MRVKMKNEIDLRVEAEIIEKKKDDGCREMTILGRENEIMMAV